MIHLHCHCLVMVSVPHSMSVCEVMVFGLVQPRVPSAWSSAAVSRVHVHIKVAVSEICLRHRASLIQESAEEPGRIHRNLTLSLHTGVTPVPGLCTCRDVLHRWRENTVARVDEAKKTSRARAHYRRTVCFKVRYGGASWSPRRVWDYVPPRW